MSKKKIPIADDRFKAIWKDIEDSTFANEAKLLTMLALSCQLMNERLFQRVYTAYRRHGYIVREEGMLKGLNDYCKAVRSATFLFEKRIEPGIISATFFAGMEDDDISKVEDTEAAMRRYDQFQNDASAIVRLVMLFVDRCSHREEAFLKVFGTLKDLPSTNFFKDEDYERYKTIV